ncbi:MAG: 30S ribosomal protein S16 [Candidatus Omnitrophica bacterium CG08_land_8_20_14_0_20_41_16]|uniref:Small ribosomal subunit protein bS16 n=1 Tax=Candidatus Sherwoodlollariibacterium unditelluris TaxID=1974757 RepID=A0A2G9YK97_9BACT|nr:MAG: 30S ribosomal protein S16 [Candidatus Omnitrophica bacterium CG23_combo_of_CG06-09_8_20_14_all_41_10]PIS33663.1 MAG: 30S ribosomal protein S16 [Candidatus Omnitrophica bacterium CG08_land_8_20_14_0_20_41_16]
MAVHIRLRRIGKNPKGKPHFRISVFDEREGRDGRVLEELGFYNPLTGEAVLKKEKIEAWIKNGAQLSATVKSLLKKFIKKENKNATTGS